MDTPDRPPQEIQPGVRSSASDDEAYRKLLRRRSLQQYLLLGWGTLLFLFGLAMLLEKIGLGFG